MANTLVKGGKGPGIEFTAVPGNKIERLAFHAAALTCGFEPPENGPELSNCYTKERPLDKRDPYPGELSFLLSLLSPGGLDLRGIRLIWEDEQVRKETLEEAISLPAQITLAKTTEEIKKTATAIENTTVCAMVVFMWHLNRGRMQAPTGVISTREKQAIDFIDKLPGLVRNAKNAEQRKRLAAQMGNHWQPCIYGWLKAWQHNMREQAHKWHAARKTIRIDRRESGKLPLLIPITKDPVKTQRMIDRWT